MRPNHPIFLLLGRLMMSYISATSGLSKMMDWSGKMQYVSTRHLPMIPALLALAMLLELAGSLSLVTGYQAGYLRRLAGTGLLRAGAVGNRAASSRGAYNPNGMTA